MIPHDVNLASRFFEHVLLLFGNGEASHRHHNKRLVRQEAL